MTTEVSALSHFIDAARSTICHLSDMLLNLKYCLCAVDII